jgi:hypothetical protein
MTRAFLALAVTISAAGLVLAPASPLAQQAKKQTVKTSKGEKVCRVKLKYSGEVRSWVCKKEEPCCVWHEINYVKCGSTTFGCL